MFGNWKPTISCSWGYNVEALQGRLETLEIGICMARNWRSLNVAGGIRKILIWIFVARAARELYLNQPTDESYNAKIWVPTFPEYHPGIGLRKNQREALHLVVIPSFPVSILRWASMEVTSGILIRGFSILAGLAITRLGNKMKVSKVMGDPQVTTAMPQLFQLLSHGCPWQLDDLRIPHLKKAPHRSRETIAATSSRYVTTEWWEVDWDNDRQMAELWSQGGCLPPGPPNQGARPTFSCHVSDFISYPCLSR